MPDFRIGGTLGAFEPVSVIGRGGMAIVYKARQPRLGRFVALKILATELARDHDFVARFQQEAKNQARLEHPNIVPIYDVGEADSAYYIAMRYVDGNSLAQLIDQQGPFPLQRALQILIQVASALDYAHSQGVVHRDLKPGNILLEGDDRVSLADFGIARAEESGRLTRLGTIVGTPEYMAPEQALGQDVDSRADLYAFGIVAYELLAGRVPFQADSDIAVLHQQAYSAPPPLRGVHPDLPPHVDAAVGRMLAKDPQGRYPTATAFVADLAEVVDWSSPRSGQPMPPSGSRSLPVGVALTRPRASHAYAPILATVLATAAIGATLAFGPRLFPHVTIESEASATADSRALAVLNPTPVLVGTTPIPAGPTVADAGPTPSVVSPTIVIASSTPSLAQLQATATAETSTRQVSLTSTTVAAEPPIDTALLQSVTTAFGQLPSGGSAVFQNLNGPEHVEFDAAHEVPAASTIKLAIMTEVFRQSETGQISLQQIQTITPRNVVGGTGILQTQIGRSLTTMEVLETTLIYSDNTGGNILIDLVGMNNINVTMGALGFSHTRLARHFMDQQAQQRGLENMTSAADVAELLRRIYRGALINPSASAEMLRILHLRGEQADPTLDFLGRRLLPRPSIGHVNGILPGIRNDAGIIDQDGRAYVIAVFLHDQTNESAAEDAIATASQSVLSAMLRFGG